MKKTFFVFLSILSLPCFAQYSGPAVESCRAYARREAMQGGAQVRDIHIERDQNLTIERYTRKAGSQFVSSVLTGHGAVVYASAPSAELAFVCLLSNDKTPVFFQWLARPNVQAISQCTRSRELRESPRPCLESLMLTAEQDLLQIATQRFSEARERDGAAGNEAATGAYRKSSDQWREYRDAECARRAARPPEGISADDWRLACAVEMTRRRTQELGQP